ncbi:alpha/beta hydrolase-fold protein [Nisaea acidiphila]|uniref:Alpha/beta hydrolase-fold protein n=1 Tax=Nisaea acidiphila TaxID=1862145 RepID=A0A9J7AQ43_9PROT|nr:alpha/beta hydrolase-fold protein [Nisaea acidiphila]UUX49286.1 alpha/beta hydrolase-fold protein [Nisaea acidiphila]
MRYSFNDVCPAPLPGTRYFDFRPDDAPNPDSSYRVFVHVPEGEAPEDGWPALYMTDGNAVIGTAVDALRAQASYPRGTGIGPGVIVAIGYPTDAAYDPFRRSWDLSPPPGAEYPPFHDGGPVVRTGGAEFFLSFLLDTLRPWLHARLPVNGGAESLFGHSFGGLFTLYALATRPAAFRNWIAASPAIYWEDEVIRTYLDRMPPTGWENLSGRVLLSAGEFEGGAPAPFERGRSDETERLAHRRKIRTIHLAEELSRDILRLTGRAEAASFEQHPGENHMSVLPVAVNRAVQNAFRLSPQDLLK